MNGCSFCMPSPLINGLVLRGPPAHSLFCFFSDLLSHCWPPSGTRKELLLQSQQHWSATLGSFHILHSQSSSSVITWQQPVGFSLHWGRRASATSLAYSTLYLLCKFSNFQLFNKSVPLCTQTVVWSPLSFLSFAMPIYGFASNVMWESVF